MKEEISINKPYNGNPDWNIGGLFVHDDFWIPLLNGMKSSGIKIPIQYIYGTPHELAAGGGRNIRPRENKLGYTEPEILENYYVLGVGCRLAFSNHLLEPEDYKEKKLNNCLHYINEYPNDGVILCDDNFNDYIADKYPNLQRICSVIRPAIDVGWGNETPEYYDKLCEKYDIVVVSCGFAKDIEKINKLKYKDKIEVLVNTRCTLNCKLAKDHYDIVAQGYLLNKGATERQKSELKIKERELGVKCSEIKKQDLFGGANFCWEEVQQLLDNGIHHFKLEGRNWPIEVMCKDICYYICDDMLFTRLCTNGLGMTI